MSRTSGGVDLAAHLLEDRDGLEARDAAAADPGLRLGVLACGGDIPGHVSTQQDNGREGERERERDEERRRERERERRERETHTQRENETERERE